MPRDDWNSLSSATPSSTPLNSNSSPASSSRKRVGAELVQHSPARSPGCALLEAERVEHHAAADHADRAHHLAGRHQAEIGADAVGDQRVAAGRIGRRA